MQAFFGEAIAAFFFIWVIMGLVKSKKYGFACPLQHCVALMFLGLAHDAGHVKVEHVKVMPSLMQYMHITVKPISFQNFLFSHSMEYHRQY